MRAALRTVILLALTTVAACETNVPKSDFPEITFAHLPPISLDVARIEVVSLFEAPLKAPHVEHEMPVPPRRAVERWVSDRLRAAGKGGTAKIIIRDASVVEDKLRPLGGIKGALTTEQSERYIAKVEVEIEAIDGRGLSAAHAAARANRSRTVAEDASLRQRETLWFELTEQLMHDFDRAFEKEIRTHLTSFIR